jgi:hypothetical protein
MGAEVFGVDELLGRRENLGILGRSQVSGGGYACHESDRAFGRMSVFGKWRDVEAFEEIIGKRRLG